MPNPFVELHVKPGDPGPIYAETDMSRFPVEPWNAASLLIFLLIAVHFFLQIRDKVSSHRFIACCLPVLLLGTFGGAMYHSCRCDPLWLLMDYLPIAFLAVATSVRFWFQLFLFHRRAFSVAATILIVLLFAMLPLRPLVSRQVAISLGYINLAVLLLFPAFLLSFKNSWQGSRLLILGALSFAVAIQFRILDFSPNIKEALPMGTHFLWHLFGGIAAYFVMKFVLTTDVFYEANEVFRKSISDTH